MCKKNARKVEFFLFSNTDYTNNTNIIYVDDSLVRTRLLYLWQVKVVTHRSIMKASSQPASNRHNCIIYKVIHLWECGVVTILEEARRGGENV